MPNTNQACNFCKLGYISFFPKCLRMVKCKHGHSRAPQSEHISVVAKDLGQYPKSTRYH